MDLQETHQQGIEASAPQLAPHVPPSLLVNVMNRIERHHAYLAGPVPRLELQAALEDPRWEIRAAALRSLGQRGELHPILAALQDEHRQVRATAIRVLGTALGSAGAETVLAHLVQALQDPAWEVREMAVFALGKARSQDYQVIHALFHLAQQDACESVRDAARIVRQSLEAPLVTAPSRPVHPWRSEPRHLWLVLSKQITVMPRGIWIVTALAVLLGGVLALISAHASHVSSTVFSGGLLAFLVVGAATTGVAWSCGQEHDHDMEWVLVLPTSMRVVLLFRLLLVLVYTVLLASGVASLVALLSGESVWHMVQLWLVPLLCLSSLSLALSILVGSLLATQVALLLEAFQALVLGLERFAPGVQATLLQPVFHLADWSRFYTNPALLPLAVLCVGLALLYAPRRPRLLA